VQRGQIDAHLVSAQGSPRSSTIGSLRARASSTGERGRVGSEIGIHEVDVGHLPPDLHEPAQPPATRRDGPAPVDDARRPPALGLGRADPVHLHVTDELLQRGSCAGTPKERPDGPTTGS